MFSERKKNGREGGRKGKKGKGRGKEKGKGREGKEKEKALYLPERKDFSFTLLCSIAGPAN